MKEKKSIVGCRRCFLLVSAVMELLIEFGITLFTVLIGYHGFVAGEMGTMLGIFSVAILVFLLPLATLRLFGLYGLYKRRQWGYVLSIIHGILVFAGGLFSLTSSPAFFILILFYTGIVARLSIRCLKGATGKQDKAIERIE